MPWLRIDDAFDTHPKIVALGSDARRWTWQRILVYTCRHRSDVVPRGIHSIIAKATPAFIRDCISLKLIDQDEAGVLHVHDWKIYNSATLEAKVTAFLEQNPGASANEVYRAIGGKRELVLAIVAEIRTSSPQVPPQVPGNHLTGSFPGSQSGSRAREPVPPPSLDLPANERFAVDVADAPVESEHGKTDLSNDQDQEHSPTEPPPGDVQDLIAKTISSVKEITF